MFNYYCNNHGFDRYEDARSYADLLLNRYRIYKCIFTKAEMESMTVEA
jgi:hypothetical protein